MVDKKNREGLANLFREFSESVSASKENAAEYLKEQGINPDELIKEGMSEIKKSLFLKQAKQYKQEGESLLEKAVHKLKDFINENKDKSKDVLLKLMNEKAPSVQFRNMDRLDDDDIREILADVDLVKFLEEFN